MKRYKLLKDLPYARAGEVFERNTHKSKDGLSDYDYLEIKKRVKVGEDEVSFGIKYNYFLDNFDKWFEEIQEESTDSIHWKPKIGQRYFYIDDGYVFSDVWIDSRVDNRRYMAGAIYCAEADAKKALKRQIAITTLMRDSNFEPDWSNNDQNKWTVYYNHNDKELLVEATAFLQYPSAIYFDTYDSIKKSIKNHKKEWLIYLGVEDD